MHKDNEIFLNLFGENSLINGSVEFPAPDGVDGNKSKVWYFQDREGQKWVVKQYPEWVHATDITWIHSYMNKLSQKGFPLAKHVGKAVEYNKQFYAIYSFAEGTRFDPLNKSHFVDMALKLGQLHILSQDIIVYGNRNWPVVAGFEYRGNHESLVYAWNIASKLLQGTDEGIVMPIHGDYRKDNVRFNQNGVSSVFDFGNARNDYPEVDLAIALKDITGKAESPDLLEKQREFLQVYKDSNMELPRISPNLICASGIILGIQEISYLHSEVSTNNDQGINNLLTRESRHLESLLTNLDGHLSLYREIFTK